MRGDHYHCCSCVIEFDNEVVIPYDAYFKEHDEGITVEVADLPGCITDGANFIDALKFAQEAAQDWVDNSLMENEKIILNGGQHRHILEELSGKRVIVYVHVNKSEFVKNQML